MPGVCWPVCEKVLVIRTMVDLPELRDIRHSNDLWFYTVLAAVATKAGWLE